MRWYILAKPFQQTETICKKLIVFQWQICTGNGGTPLKAAFICLTVVIDDLIKSRNCKRISAENSNFIVLVYTETYIVKQHPSVHTGTQFLHIKDLVP